MLNKKIIYIFVISVIIAITGMFLFLFFQNKQDLQKDIIIPAEEEECELVADDCNDRSCAYYFMCETDTNVFSSCSVYECQGKYKVVLAGDNGQELVKDYSKPDLPKINEQSQNCQGEIIILNQKCVSDKLNLKIQIITQGDCSVQSFLIKSDVAVYTPEFEKTDDIYDLTINGCVEIKEIIAVAEGGFSLNLILDI